MEKLSSIIQDPVVLAVVTFLSLLIGFIGILLAIYFYKKQAKRAVIRGVMNQPIEVGRGLSKIFPEFRLTYTNEPVHKDIRVFKGTFTNESDKDIEIKENFNTISIYVMPDTCSVMDVRITNSSKVNDIDASVRYDKKNIIDFNLPAVFFSKGFFEFHAIFMSPDDVSEGHILYDTTIPNIDLQNGINEDVKPKRKRILYIMIIMAPILVSFFVWRSDFYYALGFMYVWGIVLLFGIAFLLGVISGIYQILRNGKKENK